MTALNSPAAPAADATSRRGLLPDIEEINSTLRASADGGAPRNEVGPARSLPEEPQRRKSGFMRGFAIALLIAVLLGLIYSNSRQIADAVPQADPMLSAYVALVDQARIWLDAQANALLPRQ